MTSRVHPPLAWLTGLVSGAGLLLASLGVVMGETHVPTAIQPDAVRGAGVEVATFALG
jgi:hypothetical protein